jgi:predicted Zn-dependent peptidase
MLRSAVFAAALAGCASPRSAVSVAQDQLTIKLALANETFSLPNGLLVVMHREPSAAAVYVGVRYDVGAADDPVGHAGTAHLVEHLMFFPPKHGGSRRFGTWIDRAGGGANAETSVDTTEYFEMLPPTQLPLALWLESDRMAYPLASVDEESFTKERDVVENEWRERIENVDYGYVELLTREAVFGAQHPYARSPGGRLAEIDATTLEDVRAFTSLHYRPDHATLVVAGAIDPKSARELVTRYFASIPPGHARPWPTPPPFDRANMRVIEIAADVPHPALTLAWRAPRIHGDGFEELRMAVGVYCAIAADELVLEQKLARDVHCDIWPGRQASMIYVQADFERGTDPGYVRAGLDAALAQGAKLGRTVPWAGFRDVQTKVVVDIASSMERLPARASQLLHGVEFHGGQPDALQADMTRLSSIAPSDIGSAIEHFMQRAPRVTVVVTPTPGAPRAGRVVVR